MPGNDWKTSDLDARGVLAEAERCLYCHDAPCASACPVHIDIPGFIAMIRSGNLPGAAGRIRSANALAMVCGRICPSEIYCEPACTRASMDSPVRIRELHLHATQSERVRALRPVTASRTGRRVAVLGGGPAGLSCAFELSKLGHAAHLYNEGPPGGVPRRSIPSFRLPGEDLAHDTELLCGFITVHDAVIDAALFRDVAARHDALFVSVGLGRDRPLGIAGEHLEGVRPVLGFLESARRGEQVFREDARVVVVGGGNVSLDAAATAKRLGASSVVLLYRRTPELMRAWKAERLEAERQGVEFRFLTVPVEVRGRTGVEALRCRAMRLTADVDSSGRPVPAEIPGSDFSLPADCVVTAVGQEMQAAWLPEIRRTSKGYIEAGADLQTSMPGVFAGGDAVGGEGTVVLAVAHGVRAAHAIHHYITGKRGGA